jgi:hypothetical protein
MGREVFGDVLLIKNFPATIEGDASLDVLGLAKTLWYYIGSGADPATITSQRTFERILSAY